MNKRAELIINLDQLKINYQLIESMSGVKKSIVMIKANAYGHGDAEVYETLKKFETVEGFGVASIEEAVHLRNRVKCFLKPLIVFSDISIENSDYLDEYSQNKIIPVISNERSLECFLKNTEFKNVPIFLKFNTGMNRLGLPHDKVSSISKLLKRYNRSRVDHLMSHFSDASKSFDPSAKSALQLAVFSEVKKDLSKNGISVDSTSLANSAAIEQGVGFEESHIRPGLILYGPQSTNNSWEGKMVSRLKSHVITSFDVKKGSEIGYGSSESPCDGRIYIIALGYGDGLATSYSRKEIFMNDRRVRIIGRVNMDMVSVMFDHDVDQDQNQSVEIWGGCPKKFGELADVGNKIPYELLCGISERVTRVYKSNSGEAN